MLVYFSTIWNKHRGFTLIELLIVIGIIALLALIAIPNFMTAQVRAKVSRVQADFKSISGATEAYRVDNNLYPPDNFPGQKYDVESLNFLSTPIAYLSSVPQSPFVEQRRPDGKDSPKKNPGNVNYYEYWLGQIDTATGQYQYQDGSNETGIFARYTSSGPDQVTDFGGDFDNSPINIPKRDPVFINGLYDPTNGGISRGDLLVSNRGIEN